MKALFPLILFCLCCMFAHAMEQPPRAIEDIMESIIERNPEADLEQLEQQLQDLQQHPINLNTASPEQLSQLFWLTPEQQEQILLYVYHHPMQTLYELQLVPGLHDYDIRNLLPFVCLQGAAEMPSLTQAMRGARHELLLRFDARHIEQTPNDPYYGQIRYSMRASDRIQLGAVLKREPGEIPNARSRYGAYVELHDIWKIRTIVAGDYRASFGLGLVMNASLPISKSFRTTQLGLEEQGLRKYSGASDDFLRGAGVTMRFGPVDVSAFYSARLPKARLWQQTAGLNMQYRSERWRVGVTAVEFWATDSVRVTPMYYNALYFRGRQQLSLSADAQYRYKRLSLLGEVAVSENERWGVAAIAGMRYAGSDYSLLLLGRYYSPYYDARYASTFGEGSRVNDESGVYIGMDISRFHHWKLNAYLDFFFFEGPKYQIREPHTWGYDLMMQALYLPSDRWDMQLRWRNKRKGSRDMYGVRWQLNNHWQSFSLRTQIDANLSRESLSPLFLPNQVTGSSSASSNAKLANLGYGVSAFEQLEYRVSKVPIVMQLRLQGFYAPTYSCRIYTYENDVLYSFSLPATYGIGARYMLNMRYQITPMIALYLRLSDTWYARQWAADHQSPTHKTDIHFLFRLRL